MASLTHRLVISVILMWSGASLATAPLMDSIEFEGRRTTAWPSDKPWLDLPPSTLLTELRRKEHCSAIGGPRARWRVEDGRLWLVGLFSCGGDIRLADVYGGTGEPIFADWITGKVMTHRGKQLCKEPNRGIGLFETTIILDIYKGTLSNVEAVPNANHPAVATLEDLRTLLRRDGKLSEAQVEAFAKEIVAESGWERLSPASQRKIRGDATLGPVR